MKTSYLKTKNGGERPVELDENLVGQPGVRRFKQRDGSGREDWYWVANMMIEAKQNARRWSCSKHGDKEAHAQAVAQRLEWEKLKLQKTKEKKKAKAKEQAMPKTRKSAKPQSTKSVKLKSEENAKPKVRKGAKPKAKD